MTIEGYEKRDNLEEDILEDREQTFGAYFLFQIDKGKGGARASALDEREKDVY